MTDWIDMVAKERQRQFELPGTEGDYAKSPDNWIATIISILGEGTERSGIPPTRHDFERAILKTAAVCLAALDHLDHMAERKKIIEG